RPWAWAERPRVLGGVVLPRPELVEVVVCGDVLVRGRLLPLPILVAAHGGQRPRHLLSASHPATQHADRDRGTGARGQRDEPTSVVIQRLGGDLRGCDVGGASYQHDERGWEGRGSRQLAG